MKITSIKGSTRNIADAPTKLLGRLVVVSTNNAKNVATSEFENKIVSALEKIDERPFIAENEVWIWNNYLAISFHLQLMV